MGTTEAESAFLARGRKGGEHQERQKVEEYEKKQNCPERRKEEKVG